MAKQAYIIPIYILGYTYRYTKGYRGGSNREIKYIPGGARGEKREGEREGFLK